MKIIIPFISKSFKLTSPNEYSSIQYSIHFCTSSFVHESIGWTKFRKINNVLLIRIFSFFFRLNTYVNFVVNSF